MKRHNCQARQYGDQMICAPCGLNWDTNDPDPPECRKNIKRAIARVAKIEAEALPVMPHRYGQGRLPDQLPPRLGVGNGQDLSGQRPRGCCHAGGVPFISG